MYAVEFETQLENGAIQVPEIYKTALLVKVIILKETPTPALWSPKIMAGIPDMPAFESYREELLPVQAAPFTFIKPYCVSI